MAETLGRTIALYGLTGTGKSTQAGQHAKRIQKLHNKKTRLVAADMGGQDSIQPLIDLGVISEVNLMPEDVDPWTWINSQVSGPINPDIGLVIYDSGTGMSEALMSNAAKLATQGVKIGTQPAAKFNVPGGMAIGANTESHYLVVQTFMMDAIWKSTWLARKGVDVLWTFGEHRAENPNEAAIVGPQLAGKALSGKLPKWLRYTLRLVTEADLGGGPPKHVMYIQEKSELNGQGMSFANARYPLEANTVLPFAIEPANINTFWDIIENGQQEARDAIRMELGL